MIPLAPREKPYKQYLLIVLMLIYSFNFMERMAFGILLQDIKVDLALSDTQLGVLTGIATAFFYAVVGIPIARWADRGNRVLIIGLMAALQCAAVAMMGLAASFLQLLLIRFIVSVGEAGCVPPAHSLIADYFNRGERPRAVAIYKLGISFSYMIGYFAAGGLNETYGWRLTFIFLSLPGLALAALAWLTLREPRCPSKGAAAQGALPQSLSSRSEAPGFTAVCKALWASTAFRHLLLAFCVWYFFAYGLSNWQPAFFIRTHALETGELGLWLAAIHGIAGGVGTYWGGVLAERYAAENEHRQLLASAGAFACLPVVLVCGYLAPNHYLALAALGTANLVISLTLGPIFGSIQTLVPQRMRAMSIAIVFLCANLVGMGLGPVAVGALSDLLQPISGQQSLRYALILMCPGLFWAAWHLWRASRTVVHEIAAMPQVREA